MTETKNNSQISLTTLKDLEDLPSNRIDVIMLHSQKGGPGKTTLSCNLANELARRGKKTVIIDLDVSQPTLQHIFNIKDIKITINDILLGNNVVSENNISSTSVTNLSVIVAQEKIDYGEGLLSLLKSIHDHSHFILHEMMKTLQNFGYQYVILDCAPGYRIESIHAATVADARIFVLRPSTFSFEGAKEMLQDIYKKLSYQSLNFFIFNQIPPELKDKSLRLLKEWKEEIENKTGTDNIFLGFFNISNEIIENCIWGEYFFPRSHPLHNQLSCMVDTVIQNIDLLKQDEIISGSQKRINLETTEVSTKGE